MAKPPGKPRPHAPAEHASGDIDPLKEALKAAYDSAVREGVPDRFQKMVANLRKDERKRQTR